jgi:hypothetical protein
MNFLSHFTLNLTTSVQQEYQLRQDLVSRSCYLSSKPHINLLLFSQKRVPSSLLQRVRNEKHDPCLLKTIFRIGFKVLAAVSTKMAVFWVVAPCSLEVYQRFRGPCCLIALMMEAPRTSETLLNFYPTTRRYNTKDSQDSECLLFEDQEIYFSRDSKNFSCLSEYVNVACLLQRVLVICHLFVVYLRTLSIDQIMQR